jgi:hypothetical protein
MLTANLLLAQSTGQSRDSVSLELQQQSIDAMRRVLDCGECWFKVHAAENLLGLNYMDGVKETFLAEYELHGGEPECRIGIWRVLAHAVSDKRE